VITKKNFVLDQSMIDAFLNARVDCPLPLKDFIKSGGCLSNRIEKQVLVCIICPLISFLDLYPIMVYNSVKVSLVIRLK